MDEGQISSLTFYIINLPYVIACPHHSGVVPRQVNSVKESFLTAEKNQQIWVPKLY